MFEAIGIAATAIVVGFVVFVSALRLMDKLRWWSDAGLAAIIPMFAVAAPVAVACAGFVVWLAF